MLRSFLKAIRVGTTCCSTLAAVGAVFGQLPTPLEEASRQQAESAADRQEVLVLENGNVLRGRMIDRGSHFEVVGDGGTLRVSSAEVEIRAASLGEAYEQKRARLPRPTADHHVQLAKWCLRHGLYQEAARELLDARGLDADHPQVTLVERRLEVVSAQPPSSRRPAEAKQPAVKPPVGNAHETAELVAQLDELPDGALERFTRKIQPLLVNNCTTAGCHRESDKHQFRLSRALLYGQGNRTTTLRNLRATLTQIDRNHPLHSPLVTVPLKPHGSLSKAVFPPHRRHLHQHIVTWVAGTFGPAAGLPPGGPARQQMAGKTPPSTSLSVYLQGMAAPAERFGASPGVVPANLEQPVTTATTDRRPSRLQYGTRVRRVQPRDPFDPEIFNRRFGEPADGESHADPESGQTPNSMPPPGDRVGPG